MALNFCKMHGLGNDFVVIDVRQGTQVPPRAALAALTDRRTGIGCDQLILLEDPPAGSDAALFMRILNAPDACEAEACGNATRCVAALEMKRRGVDELTIQTVAGLLPCRREAGSEIIVDMGVPRLGWQDIPLSEQRDTLNLGIGQGDVCDPVGVNVGNPHAVFFVPDVAVVDIATLGPRFENDPLFPARANIEFAQVIDRDTIRMRVWERGAGITMACGSGACAAMVAAVRRGLTGRQAAIVLDGGTLRLEWRESDSRILMAGPATHVYDGVVFLD